MLMDLKLAKGSRWTQVLKCSMLPVWRVRGRCHATEHEQRFGTTELCFRAGLPVQLRPEGQAAVREQAHRQDRPLEAPGVVKMRLNSLATIHIHVQRR